jgi:hypothetical protein
MQHNTKTWNIFFIIFNPFSIYLDRVDNAEVMDACHEAGLQA